MRAPRTNIVIISPALRDANNGNWRTAHRWSRFLDRRFHVAVCTRWTGASSPAVMIALHARRSADAVDAFARAYPDRPRVLVLTGTDLYRDIGTDAAARRTLDLATHLVVLQEAALDTLAPRHRRKCRVIYQSASPLEPGVPRRRTFDVILVGHMRAEKDPLTPMRALEWLPADSRVRLIHVGEASTDEYARAANALQKRTWPSVQRYRWLGGRPHGETRRRIRDARAMVISSVMEGGANVIVEAVTCGVPVVASRIAGNVGMLGRDYAGYFAPGDDRELAHLLERVSRDGAFVAELRGQCAGRAVLFDPSREDVEVNRLIDAALAHRMPLA
ncbi:MAG: selenoneine biosynthesis selenosugar synthase SenB [Casimicrobiaceae bacterium]